jgi:hypothetical protein
MQYEKPEVSTLGDASHLIQGATSKAGNGEQGLLQAPADCEMDD